MVEKVAWASGSARQTMRCETANRRENERGVQLIRPNPPRRGTDRTADERLLPSWEGSGARRFMESTLSFFSMHWDHEPRTSETAPPKCCRHLAGSAFLWLVCRQDAGSTLGFLESLLSLSRMHWDHEPFHTPGQGTRPT